MQGTALGVAATFGLGEAVTLDAPDPAIFEPPMPPPAGPDIQPARIAKASLDRAAAAVSGTSARRRDRREPPAAVALRPLPDGQGQGAAVAAAAAARPGGTEPRYAGLAVAAADDRQDALSPPPGLDFGPAPAPGAVAEASMDRPAAMAIGSGVFAVVGGLPPGGRMAESAPSPDPNFPLPLVLIDPAGGRGAASLPTAPADIPFAVAGEREASAVGDGLPRGSAAFADLFESAGRDSAAAAGAFPAFGDGAAAPWIGAAGAQRQALIDHAGLERTVSDRAGDADAGNPAAPDPDDATDGTGAATAATADGQAREGDLLSLQTLSRGGLALSGGYSSIEGPIGSIKIARTNIGAPGRDITASARYSKVQMVAEFGVSDSNFIGSKIAVAPTFFYSRSSAVGFDKTATSSLFRQTARGINLYIGRPLDRGLRVAANYRFSDEDFLIRRKNALCDVGLHGSPFCNALGRSTSSVISISLSLDRRDSAVDPTRGFQLRVTQDIAGPGGTTRYVRLRTSGSFHRRLSGNLDVSLGLEGGYMKGFDGRDIPLFDRFYIGGNSMRGFDLRGLGPKVIPTGAAAGQTTAIGGSAYYVGRLELSTRVGGPTDRFGVSPSVFVDAGSLFGAKRSELLADEQLIGNSAKPRVAVGVGVSLNVAPGKLRFNVARPVVRQRGDRARTFSITFGTAF